MSAKKRKRTAGQNPPPVSEYKADYREGVLSAPEESPEPDSLSFSADYRQETGEKITRPMSAFQPEAEEEQPEEAHALPDWVQPELSGQADEVVIDTSAYDEPVASPDVADSGMGLVTDQEILPLEDLPEEEEPVLDKEEAGGLGEVVMAAARPRHKRRRYGIPVGVAVLSLALVGVVFLAVTIGQAISHSRNDDSQLREYDNFLAPVVMQDPAPFETIDSVDPDLVMTASLWFAISQKGAENYDSFDAEGRSLIPLGDVTAACRDLFGPNCVLQPGNPKEETFFTFDSEDNQFHVAPYSSQSSYTPYTEQQRRSGDALLLTVGYVSPVDDYLSDETGQVRPKPAKYMEYELRTNPNTGKLYIHAIRSVGHS